MLDLALAPFPLCFCRYYATSRQITLCCFQEETCGYCARLYAQWLSKQVDVFNPFAGFEIKDSVLSSAEESMGAFATPLGLAMRGLADAS